MKQQTAVEWLIKELKHVMDAKDAMGSVLDVDDLEYYLPLAKEREHKQITKAYNDGYRDGLPSISKEGIDISEYDNARLYYKEIYD